VTGGATGLRVRNAPLDAWRILRFADGDARVRSGRDGRTAEAEDGNVRGGRGGPARRSNAVLLRDTQEHEIDSRCGCVAERQGKVRRAAVAMMRVEWLATAFVIVMLAVGLGGVMVVRSVVEPGGIVSLAAAVIVGQSVEDEVERRNAGRTDGEEQRHRGRGRPVSPCHHPATYDGPAVSGLPVQG
jgi:hypothetical protein